MSIYEEPEPVAEAPIAEAPKRNTRRWVLIALVALGLLCACGCGVVTLAGGGIAALLGITQPIADAGDAFMQDLSAGDFDSAFRRMSTAGQAAVGDPNTLGGIIDQPGLRPAEWNFTSRNIENNTDTLEGTVTFIDGRTGTVDMTLVQEGEEWKIQEANLVAD
jgi:hypothetical protein